MRAWRARRGETTAAAAALRRARKLDVGALPRPEDRFRALMIMSRFEEAFAQAETILDEGSFLSPHDLFWNPWDYHPRELRGLEKLASPWADYYRGTRQAFPVERYGWMNLRAGVDALNRCRFEEAERLLEGATRWEWKAYGHLAEARICLRRPAKVRAALAALSRSAPAERRHDALAWRGELELWLGRYATAYRALDQAAKLGSLNALCWRAAAAFRLGRERDALRLLDETREKFPADLEAPVWRGEVLRALGRPREALAALEPAGPALWARWNRALALHELGDQKGFLREHAALPDEIVWRLRAQLGSKKEPGGVNAVRAFLAAGLRQARGFRREEYKQHVWLD